MVQLNFIYITPASLPPGEHAINVTAATAANQASAGVAYLTVFEIEQAPDSSGDTGGQILDSPGGTAMDGTMGIAGIIVLVAYITQKWKKPRNFIVTRRT